MSKSVVYRGGIVTFSIPDAWREEHDPSGGATFYEDRPNSGTLRLKVLSFESQSTAAQQMARTAFPAGSFTLLPMDVRSGTAPHSSPKAASSYTVTGGM